MVPPVAFLTWIIVLDLLRPIASSRTDAEAGGTLHTALPPEVVVHHIAGRRTLRPPPPPDLIAWADRLDSRCRIVVLDIGRRGPRRRRHVELRTPAGGGKRTGGLVLSQA
jgi:hypothetical protein